MRSALTFCFFALTIAFAARAQSPNQTASSVPPQAVTTQPVNPPTNTDNSAQQSAISITLKRRPDTPDTPQPKSDDDQRAACPAGNGKPCAILGGRAYYSDALGLSLHNKSWSAAATSPSMLLAIGLLTAATIADIETTQSCILFVGKDKRTQER